MIFPSLPTQDELQHVPPDDDYRVPLCPNCFYWEIFTGRSKEVLKECYKLHHLSSLFARLARLMLIVSANEWEQTDFRDRSCLIVVASCQIITKATKRQVVVIIDYLTDS